jgi:hypothetical protein
MLFEYQNFDVKYSVTFGFCEYNSNIDEKNLGVVEINT